MLANHASSLERAIACEFVNLSALGEKQASARPADAGSWSRKQELGHPIDSAVNNIEQRQGAHIRFAKASLEREYTGPAYDQDGWVRTHGYNEPPWLSLIDAWRQHDAPLVQVVRRIRDERLAAPCVIAGASPVTPGFLIEDYIPHMQHHLDHILGRAKITHSPGAAAGI
jgi:hypothetical protein